MIKMINEIINLRDNTITLAESWNDLIKDFILNLDRKEATKETYRKALKEWVRFIENVNKIPNMNVILQYKEYLINKQLSPHTVSVYLSALKVFFDYLVQIKKIPFNPAKSIRGIKKTKSKRDSLTKDEVLRLLALSFDDSLEGQRNKSILYLKLFTGLRDVSLVHANIEDLQVKEDRHILYYLSKGRHAKDSFVVLVPEVYNVLNAYLIQRGNPDKMQPLFVSCSDRNRNQRLSTQMIRLVIKGLLKKAQIIRKEVSPHSIRHTAITLSILGGADITQTKEMASHRSISTTAEYFHDLNRLKDPAEFYIRDYIGISGKYV